MTAVRVIEPKTGGPDPGAPPAAASEPKAAGAPRPVIPPRAPASAKNKSRVLLPVTDGKIEWKNMPAEARGQFEELFKNPDFLKQFGLKGDVQMMTAEQAAALYDMVSMVYSQVCRFLLKWPPEALALLAYSKEQKEALSEPTAAVLNKFAPTILMEHKELIVWGGMFLMTTNANFLQAKNKAVEIFKQQAEQKKLLMQTQPQNGKVAPIIPQVPAPISAPIIQQPA